MKKSTKAIFIIRVKDIYGLILNGSSREEILQYSSENWNVGERQGDNYIKSAKELLTETTKKDLTYDYYLALARFNNLYKKAIEKDDIRTALMINKEIAFIQSLHKENNIHPEMDKDLYELLTPTKLQQRMFETPMNRFLDLPENRDLKERFKNFQYMEAFANATKGMDLPDISV